jgi:hypothetical protein
MSTIFRSRPTVVIAASLATLSLAFSATSAAVAGSGSPARSSPLHGRVPAAQLAIFHVLKRPALRKLPRRVSRALAQSPAAHQMGADPNQARQVGTATKPFYLVPGTQGICLVLSDGGSVCTRNLTWVASYGLEVDVVNPTTNPDGSVNQWGDVTVFGVAPDGFTAATVTTDSGATVTGAIRNNSYVIHANGPIARTTFTGPGRDPVTTPDPIATP